MGERWLVASAELSALSVAPLQIDVTQVLDADPRSNVLLTSQPRAPCYRSRSGSVEPARRASDTGATGEADPSRGQEDHAQL